MSKSKVVPGFTKRKGKVPSGQKWPSAISKLRAGQPLSLWDRLRLYLWHRQQHRRCLAAWFGDQGPQHRVGRGPIWGIRIIVTYAVAGLILWLLTPLIGLGYAVLVAMLAWIVMGAYWLS